MSRIETTRSFHTPKNTTSAVGPHPFRTLWPRPNTISHGKRNCHRQILAHTGWDTIIPLLGVDHDFEITKELTYQFGFFLEPEGLQLSVAKAAR